MKKPINALLFVTVFLLSFTSEAGTQAVFYVSPAGSDNNSGSESAPFQSLVAARDAVAKINSSMSGDIIVYLRGGTYSLSSTVIFRPQDSGKNGYKIYYRAYPGETPVLSGGIKVTGWTQHQGNIYKATLNRSSKLRYLFVNDKRAQMTSKRVTARGGQGTYSVSAGQASWAWNSGSKSDGVKYSTSDVPLIGKNRDDLEIVNGTTWNENIVCVRDVITTSDNFRALLLQQPYGAIAQTPGWGAAFSTSGTHTIYNAFEFLDTPGQFYFDKSAKTLYYYIRPGENMATADVQAPIIEKLIEIAGTSPTSRVENITFEGITFANTDYNLVNVGGSYGKTTCQGANAFIAYGPNNWHDTKYDILDVHPGMVTVNHAKSLEFIGNTLKHSGSDGINMSNDVSNCNIIGNFITDITSSGITVGHPQHVYIGDGGTHARFPPSVEAICKNNKINNNVLFDISTAPGFGGCAAITAYFVEGLEITYNHVQNTAYNGIHLGWGWCNFLNSTTAKNNTVSNNRIINTLRRLHDSGGIYTIGQNPGTYINNNYVRGIPAATSGPTYGLHNDEGTAYVIQNDNVLDIDPGVKYTINCEDFGGKHHLTILRTYATVNKMGINPPNSTIDPPIVVADAVWPVNQYTTCLNSGVQDAFRSIIPAGLIPLQDYVFPASCAATAGTVLKIRSSGDTSATVWFAPAGTTIFAEGPSMTKADGTATSISVPSRNGTYKLFIVDSHGLKSSETVALLRVSGSLSTIEAENFSSKSSGVQVENCSDGGQNIGYISNGDHVIYKGIDLGTKGYSVVEARVASGGSGGQIEIRVGDVNGPLLGTCDVASTGGWQTWSTVRTSISPVSGKQDICLSFVGGEGYLFNVNWFEFLSGMTDVTPNKNKLQTTNFTARTVGRNIVISASGEKAEYEVSIFMLNGQLVDRVASSSRTLKIPLSAKGFYLLSIKHGSGKVKRMIVRY